MCAENLFKNVTTTWEAALRAAMAHSRQKRWEIEHVQGPANSNGLIFFSLSKVVTSQLGRSKQAFEKLFVPQ